MYPVNTVTALPLFQLCCALDGRESGDLVLTSTWARFLEFSALPASNADDHIGFQVEVSRDGLDVPVLAIRLTRELTDDASPYGRFTRMIFAEFLFEGVPAYLESGSLWAEDYPNLDTFRAAVEATSEYAWAVERPPTTAQFGTEDQLTPEDAG
jgi:hypothetical protein